MNVKRDKLSERPGRRVRQGKAVGRITPVVPSDARARRMMKQADESGPYLRLKKRGGLFSVPPEIEIAAAGEDVIREVNAALAGENISVPPPANMVREASQNDMTRVPIHDNIADAPNFLQDWLKELTKISGDRVEFHAYFRELREREHNFLGGIELWLRRHKFRVEDPDLDEDDCEGWKPANPEMYALEAACPRIPLRKKKREIVTDLVYIFQGMKS